MSKKITCIVCPNGCEIEIEGDKISGYTCKRGLEYAKEEMIAPKRTITSTVKIKNSNEVCPIKTSKPIPKEKIFDVLTEINKVEIVKPIKMYELVIENVLNLGVNIIATKEFL